VKLKFTPISSINPYPPFYKRIKGVMVSTKRRHLIQVKIPHLYEKKQPHMAMTSSFSNPKP
jgi:hypothetical protein